MKTLSPRCFALLLALLALGAPWSAHASDQIKSVQSELKAQGFFYGEVNGAASKEFSASLRRYQIRNGLEVNGQLTNETLESLGMSGSAASAPKAEPKPTAKIPAPLARETQEPPLAGGPPPSQPAVNLRRDAATVEQEDRRVLRQEEMRQPREGFDLERGPSRGATPSRGAIADSEPDAAFSAFLAGGPYANAPRPVQEQTVRNAQRTLAERSYYRELVDGIPGPATEEALLQYQRRMRLPLTGRLDLQTLSALQLLPGRGSSNPPLKPFRSSGAERDPVTRAYRGIWVA